MCIRDSGYHVGRRKTRHYMNEMDIYPIYTKMNLAKRMQQAKVCPYFLRNAVIDKPNQAWSIDITSVSYTHLQPALSPAPSANHLFPKVPILPAGLLRPSAVSALFPALLFYAEIGRAHV